jgi:hypothetical protein
MVLCMLSTCSFSSLSDIYVGPVQHILMLQSFIFLRLSNLVNPSIYVRITEYRNLSVSD